MNDIESKRYNRDVSAIDMLKQFEKNIMEDP